MTEKNGKNDFSWEELVQATTVTEGKKDKRFARRKIRYWCFRLQKASVEEEDLSSVEAPVGLREFYENSIGFTEWATFGISWDLRGDHVKDPDGSPLDIMPRKASVHQEWNRQVRREAKPLPLHLLDVN